MHSKEGLAIELGRMGGRRKVYPPPDLQPFDPPRTPDELRELIACTMIELREGRCDPPIANSLGFLANAMVRVVDQADIAMRLQRVEERLEKVTARRLT